MAQESKSLVNQDGTVTKLTEWATADVETVEEMEALFKSEGVSYSRGEEATGDYQFIRADEKVAFCKRILGQKLMVVKYEFRTSSMGEYVTVHMIVNGAGKFILNDSSKVGMYGQLSTIYSNRIENGWDDDKARAGVVAERGLEMNKPFKFINDKSHPDFGKAYNQNNPDHKSLKPEQLADAKPTFKFVF